MLLGNKMLIFSQLQHEGNQIGAFVDDLISTAVKLAFLKIILNMPYPLFRQLELFQYYGLRLEIKILLALANKQSVEWAKRPLEITLGDFMRLLIENIAHPNSNKSTLDIIGNIAPLHRLFDHK